MIHNFVRKNDISLCAKWKKLYENGVDVTALLSNKINHPTKDMNYLFAISLVEMFFE